MLDRASQAKPAQDFVIARVFDAPRDLVWRAFTEPERISQWMSPKGAAAVAAKMDFRPGGTYHYGVRTPDGGAMWGKYVYREIDAPKRLVWVNSFSDEAGGITRHPLSATWPLEMLTTVTFDEPLAGQTGVTIRWSPIGATEASRTPSTPDMTACGKAGATRSVGWRPISPPRPGSSELRHRPTHTIQPSGGIPCKSILI
jgi:uncharacterized protein YndB with AHSA1/START domain